MTLDCTKSESKNTIFLRLDLILAYDNILFYVTYEIKKDLEEVHYLPRQPVQHLASVKEKEGYRGTLTLFKKKKTRVKSF